MSHSVQVCGNVKSKGDSKGERKRHHSQTEVDARERSCKKEGVDDDGVKETARRASEERATANGKYIAVIIRLRS